MLYAVLLIGILLQPAMCTRWDVAVPRLTIVSECFYQNQLSSSTELISDFISP